MQVVAPDVHTKHLKQHKKHRDEDAIMLHIACEVAAGFPAVHDEKGGHDDDDNAYTKRRQIGDVAADFTAPFGGDDKDEEGRKGIGHDAEGALMGLREVLEAEVGG